MTSKIFSKKTRKDIFRLFLTKNKLEFNEIEKTLNIRSNKLAYHIKTLVKENILYKENNCYKITNEAQKFIPLFSNIAEGNLSPLPVILTALINENNQILLIKRENRPYKNYWSMIGGRILYDEDYKQASIRLIKKKSGIEKTKFISLNHIVDEKVYDNNILKNSFLLFFTKVQTIQSKFKETKYGNLKWFDLDKIKDLKLIHSDKWLIEEFLNTKTKVSQITMEEKNNALKNFEILK